MPDDSIRPLIQARSFSPTPTFEPRDKMDNLALAGGNVRRKGKLSWVVALSYVFDWIVLAAFAAIGYVLGDITPNKRPFSLDDRNIAYVERFALSLGLAGWHGLLTACVASPMRSKRRSPSGSW
jgi:hypothetical protein